MSSLPGSAPASSTFAKPALRQGVRGFIVGQSVALEEPTQSLGVSRLTQPDQGLDVQLADALVAQGKASTELAVTGGWLPIQTIVGDNDLAQPLGQAADQALERWLPGHHLGQGRRISSQKVRRW